MLSKFFITQSFWNIFSLTKQRYESKFTIIGNLFPIYESKYTIMGNLFPPKNCMKIFEKENINKFMNR